MFNASIRKLVAATAATGTLFATAPMFKATKEDKEGNTPGDRETLKTRIGETLSSVFQSHTPMNEFHTHMTDIRCLNGNLEKQMIAHSYVMHINEDFMQSVLMDSDKKDARMVGVEYIITEKVFNQLPEEERKLWSSNAYSVKSGIKVAPKLPWSAEHKLMADMAPTYSKTFMLWDKRDPLPLGIPQLLVNPTRDGIVRQDLIRMRDEELGVNTEACKRNRSDIEMPRILNGADAWEQGEIITLQAKVSGSGRSQSFSGSKQPAYSR